MLTHEGKGRQEISRVRYALRCDFNLQNFMMLLGGLLEGCIGTSCCELGMFRVSDAPFRQL